MYKKVSGIEHILMRPEMYIGSTKQDTFEQWMYTDSLEYKSVKYIPGLLKLFDEVFTNALDQYIRQKGVKKIDITFDPSAMAFSVRNDGEGIVLYQTEYGVWSPELVFSQLLTSGNYTEDRENIAGLNGLGVKLVNVFSDKFTVETCYQGTKYVQECNNNMAVINPPVITKTKLKDYTKVTYKLDIKQFGEFDRHVYNELIKTRVIASCGVISTPLKISLNSVEQKLTKASFKNVWGSLGVSAVSGPTADFDIVLTDKAGVELINGIMCRTPGFVSKKIYSLLYNTVKTRLKRKDFTAAVLRKSVNLILHANLKNPVFSSQSKDQCIGGEYALGLESFKLSGPALKYITDSVKRLLEAKGVKNLKDTDGKKKNTVSIPNLDDAKYAGTSKSKQCTLFLTEGLSAKTFAVAGVSSLKNGRDYNGIFPLKGKLLNVRQSGVSKIAANEEITNIKKILGLQAGKKYSADTLQLRYSKVYILADADVDAYHICGLIINLFHVFWPELIKQDFISIIRTPLVKVNTKLGTFCFYTDAEFKAWESTNTEHIKKKKYYKGLGSSTSAEAKEVFKSLEDNTQTLKFTDRCDDTLQLAFGKENIRKEWVRKEVICSPGEPDSYTHFINTQLRSFSVYDNHRSIPRIEDGLKVSQRKILWTLYKKKINTEIKVAQLGAATAELTDYHHGENSLYSAIVSLAQDYRGSNNHPLLEPCGNFGTHLENGEDAASPRYIFTKPTDFMRSVLDIDDLALYSTANVSESIEPAVLYPNIPLCLVNGSKGIGTGFSTDIPSYKVEDIKQEIEYQLVNNRVSDIVLVPWTKGFKGTFLGTQTSPGGNTHRYECEYSVKGNFVELKCIPTGKSVSQYKKFLEDSGYQYENKCTDTLVHFIIKYTGSDVVKDLKLETVIRETNMHLWVDGEIIKFKDPKDIIQEWIKQRYTFVEHKKASLIESGTDSLNYLKAKKDYLEKTLNEEIDIKKQSVEKLKLQMTGLYGQEFTGRLLQLRLLEINKQNLVKLEKDINNTVDSIDKYKTLKGKELFKTL